MNIQRKAASRLVERILSNFREGGADRKETAKTPQRWRWHALQGTYGQ